MARGGRKTPRQGGPSRSKPPQIVGIGASAGGVRPLQVFFENLPEDLGLSYVVILHLAPDVRSELPSILSARTAMPVTTVDGVTELEPDHVYVISPDRSLRISDHHIESAPFDQPVGKRSAIDTFFSSLAAAQADGFAVLLSGAGSDGALGVKAVKEAGGIVLVQDPREAEHPSMPNAAIGAGMVDIVLPVAELARRLSELARSQAAQISAKLGKSDEELRAANEELQSINEEYRSTSEELETSKEQLQSVNEELQTVNNELKLKLEGVSRANSDLQNLMAATDVGSLFLDPALRIRRFTPRLTDLFNITASDEGRPITDFTHQLDYDGLTADATAVLRNLTPIEREVQTRTHSWYLMRLRPYRTIDDRIDGVVATFVDITERRRVNQALLDSEARVRQETRLVELAHTPIFVWDLDSGAVVQWNRGSEELYGYSREHAIGQRKNLLLKTSVPGSSFEAVSAVLAQNGRWSGELLQRARDGRELTVESAIELVEMDGRRFVMESIRDITERKVWERRQEMMVSELSHRVKNTLAVVQSFVAQSLRGAQSPEEFTERFEGRLAALAKAHKLLVDPWKGADVEALVREQLAAYAGPAAERLTARGDAMSLPADVAVPLGLVLHELATNAVKYGAWSSPKGRVELTWTRSERHGKPILTVTWRELDGPLVSKPQRTGFGSRLISKGLPHSRVRSEFLSEGVAYTIEIEVPEGMPA